LKNVDYVDKARGDGNPNIY